MTFRSVTIEASSAEEEGGFRLSPTYTYRGEIYAAKADGRLMRRNFTREAIQEGRALVLSDDQVKGLSRGKKLFKYTVRFQSPNLIIAICQHVIFGAG